MKIINSSEWPVILENRKQAAQKRHALSVLNAPERIRKWQRKRIAELHDWYVRVNLSQGTKISTKYWPQSIVDAQRALIALRRKMRAHRKCERVQKQDTLVGLKYANPERI